MKLLQISAILILLGGCTTTQKEESDYIGKLPSYASNKVAPTIFCPICAHKINKKCAIPAPTKGIRIPPPKGNRKKS